MELELQEGVESDEQCWGVREHIYDNGTTYYSFHASSNEKYVIALENGEDINGAKIVLKYITSINDVPDSALFWNYSYLSMQVSFLYSLKSINNDNARAITSESSSNKLTNSDIKTGINNSIVQCWVFESYDRSIELNNWDLVDIGGHCDWDCSSQYSSMVQKAANAWNDYIGADVFRPDAWNIVEDVKIIDMDSDPTGENAFARTYSSDYLSNGEYARTICFYRDAMGNLQSDLQRQKTVMHELGHALGLGHNRAKDAEEKLGNIMQQGALPYSTFIGLDDKASVQEAYAGF